MEPCYPPPPDARPPRYRCKHLPSRLYAFVHVELILPRAHPGCPGHLRRYQRTLRARGRVRLPIPEVRFPHPLAVRYFRTDDCLARTYSGAATTASRLGQPDLAIATLNDFVQVCLPHYVVQAYRNEHDAWRPTERADGLQPRPHDPRHRRRRHRVRTSIRECYLVRRGD